MDNASARLHIKENEVNNIDKQIQALDNKIYPLQSKLWKLYDLKDKQDNGEFLKSGVLTSMLWRVRTYGNSSKAFLQYCGDYKIEAIEKIVPYPHSHRELAKGITLNQDDGDITLTFDTPYLMLKYIKQLKLKIEEWRNLTDLMKRLRQYRQLVKYLESQKDTLPFHFGGIIPTADRGGEQINESTPKD